MKRTHLVMARYSKGWSQEKAAEFIGVTRNTLSQWERGISDPYPFHVHKLCEIYGKTAVELDLANAPNGKAPIEKVQTPVNLPERAITPTLIASGDLLNSDILDRFYRALMKPSTIDGRFLDYLETRTEHYWQDRHGAVLA